MDKVMDSVPSASDIDRFNDEHDCCLMFDVRSDRSISVTCFDFRSGGVYDGVFTSRLVTSTFPAPLKAAVNRLFYSIYES